MPTVYYGESSGPRIIALTNDITQVTDDGTEDVFLAVEWHPIWVAGSAGVAILRELTPVVRFTNGASYRITSIVDDIPQPPQTISVGGAGTLATSVSPRNDDVVRGTRFAVLIEQVGARTGDFEIIDCGYTIAVLRRTPAEALAP